MRSSQNLRREAIAFVHSGAEFAPTPRSEIDDWRWIEGGRKALRGWNNGPHRRKFVVAEGRCRETPQASDRTGPMTFWAEWEPHSIATPLILSGEHGPNATPSFAHEPFLVRGTTGVQNTDPFVFGDCFWFTNCHQRRYVRLRKLDRGAVVLFGTTYRQYFAVDTVFVVETACTPDDYLRTPTLAPEQLRLATLDLHGLAENNRDFVFYKGKTPSGGPPFSFVPCRPVEHGGPRGHPRLMLDRAEFSIRGNTQGVSRIPRTTDMEALSDLWRRLAEQCLVQNLHLGHWVAPPPIVDNPPM